MPETKGLIKYKLSLVMVILLVIVIWIASAFIIPMLFSTLERRGQFGDMFGAVNSLFSGLAFACVIYAIVLQRKDIEIQFQAYQTQLEELKLTRDEVSRSASAQEQMDEALRVLSRVIGHSAIMSTSINATRGRPTRAHPDLDFMVARDHLQLLLTTLDQISIEPNQT